MMSRQIDRKYIEKAEDIVKTLLQWLVVSALGFAYWIFVLLLVSLFLMNIWKTSWEEILHIGIVLGAITSVFYAGVIWKRRRA